MSPVGETLSYFALGSLKAMHEDTEINLGQAKQQTVLAVLLLNMNQPVPVDTIIDAVWADNPPRDTRNTVQTYISRLRRILQVGDGNGGPDNVLAYTTAGYLLRCDRDRFDVTVFDQRVLAAQAHHRRQEWADATQQIRAALALWRGDPFSGLQSPLMDAERTRLHERHVLARELRASSMLALGEHSDAIADLARLVGEHSLRESLRGLLMTALYRSGRQAEALDVFQDLRKALADELGVDPSADLRELYQRILAADPGLNLPDSVAAGGAADRQMPRQLPAQARTFVGRQNELASLTRLATSADLAGTVVISGIGGPGGIGKTALALHWAYRHLDRFPDGQLFVNLRGFDPSGPPTPAGEALRGFLDALGVGPAALPVDLDVQVGRYRSLVAGKRMLIVLDNARDIDQIIPLLPGSSTCTVLVTSRRHLTSLAAMHGAYLLDLDVLPESDARDLLARLLGPERLTAEPQAVAELLSMCAGLPLAVRIVAARAQHHPTFPLAMLAEELRDASARLDGLDAGDLHTNLRAVLSSSVRTLGTQAANLFGLLSIAPGPDISLPAAASLLALPQGQVREALRELEHASLIQQHVPGRYRMHDLIRLYATDTAHHQLTQDVREAAMRRVLDFYTHTAYTADHLLDPHNPSIQLAPPTTGVCPQPIPDVAAALAWFDAEHRALLAAQLAAADHAWQDVVWQLAWILETFQTRRGHRHDRLVVWREALDATANLPDPGPRMLANRLLGLAYANLGRFEEGIGYLHRALTLAKEHHDPGQQSRTHRVLASAWARRGDDGRALEHAARSLALCRTLDQPVLEADALNHVGWYAARLGQFGTARTHCHAALTLHQLHDNPDGEASTLDSLGYIAHHTGDHQQAIGHYRQALTVLRALGNSAEAANTLDRLGHAHVALGEQAPARVVWREALQLLQERGRDTDARRIQRQLDALDQSLDVD